MQGAKPRQVWLAWARPFRAPLIAATVAAACQLATPVAAEPVLDRALSGLRLFSPSPSCTVVKVEFNFRIRYVSHFPLSTSDELTINVRAIDPTQAAALAVLRREALRAPNHAGAAIRAIDFELDQPAGPVLRVQFLHPVAYQVAPGSDFESLVIAIAGRTAQAGCRPVFPSRIGAGWDTTIAHGDGAASRHPAKPGLPLPAPPGRPKERPAGGLTAADLSAVAAAMDEARAALKKGNYAQAMQLLTKVLARAENEHSAGAQELLGVAYQKAGQIAQARHEYEDYLRRYPNREGSEGVRQRLDGILTATGDPSERLRASKAERAAAGEAGAPPRSSGTTWMVSGSASQFYIRDDSFRTLRDPSLPPNPNEDKDAHLTHQNSLLSSFDLSAVWSNDQFKSKFRFSGTEEHKFDDEKDIVSVAALFFETTVKQWDLMTRLGRQTRSSGGVVGRFDGGVVSWQANPNVRFNVVGGSPVERRADEPFKDDRYFYGASVDFGHFWGNLEASLFAIEQRARSSLDRQAIGGELRYIDPDKSAFALVDYDVHFQELNAAMFSGSWTLPDKSTISAGIDYRKSPYLTTWNALQGQPFLTLYDMLKLHSKEEIDQLAIDRTPTFKSATVGYAFPLHSNYQVNLDATASSLSGTVASGGIDAMLPTGTELYYSAQLMGTNLLAEGDMYIAGVRVADLAASNLYVLDLSARYPLTNELRINPRLRLGYQIGDTSDLREVTVLPSILLNYYWTRDLSLELEVGAKWTERQQAAATETETDLFFTAGFRYDFYADGHKACGFMSTCRK
ncbi:MAG: tetratricopeptide repeat protein [Hyphomicrobiaceae bacterium]